MGEFHAQESQDRRAHSCRDDAGTRGSGTGFGPGHAEEVLPDHLRGADHVTQGLPDSGEGRLPQGRSGRHDDGLRHQGQHHHVQPLHLSGGVGELPLRLGQGLGQRRHHQVRGDHDGPHVFHDIHARKYGNLQYGSNGFKVGWESNRTNPNCTTTTLASGTAVLPATSVGWHYWETSS